MLYISILTLYNDFHKRKIEDEAHIFYTRFLKILQTHPNPLIKDFFILTLLLNNNFNT